MFITRSITKPVSRLVEASNAVSKGDLTTEVKIESRDEIGKLAGSFNQMVESLKKSNSVLQSSEERFRELAENIHNVFWVTLPDFKSILYISPAYETIWGFSCESLYNQSKLWIDNVHPDDREKVTVAIKKHIQNETAFEEVYRIIRPDGSIHWVQNRAFSIQNKHGKINRIIGIAEDITESKQAEEELKRTKKNLELLQRQ